jgi:hypothetical protein
MFWFDFILRQDDMEVIKVEPDIDRETLLMVSHSEDSQLGIKDEDRPDPFTLVSVEIQDKVSVALIVLQYLQKTFR